MYSLILLAAGKFKRFGGTKPKYLYPIENGDPIVKTVIENVLKSVKIKDIYIIVRSIDNENFSLKNFFKSISKLLKIKINVMVLDKPTNGPAETAYKILKLKKLNNIIIKDCDSIVTFETPKHRNFVCTTEIDNNNVKDLWQKSYVMKNEESFVFDIIEKKIISSSICSGVYAFETSSQYCKAFEEINKDKKSEVYVSHVIKKMLSKKITFQAVNSILTDLGTKESYENFLKSKETIFCELEGIIFLNDKEVLLENDKKTAEVIDQNIDFFKRKMSLGAKVIFYTHKKPIFREKILKIFKKIGFFNFDLLFEIPIGQKTFINRYSDEIPYLSNTNLIFKENSKIRL